MKRTLALAALITFIVTPASVLLGQGPLTPPGAPAATMKSLAQIEPRTPISSVPFTISVPGSYYLTTNLTTAVSNAIVIAAIGVTLDLSGFTIYSTVASAANGGAGILISSGLRNITIQNGFIQGGVTNNGSGTYSGSGFKDGISYSGTSPWNTRVSGVSVSGVLNNGISLNEGGSTVVESCTVRSVGTMGIYASTVKNSVAVDCGGHAINCDQASDCRGESVGAGTGITTITAQNCYGTSSTGDGINALRNANNCYGYSDSGRGLYAYNASFCTGSQSGGTAIQAIIATGCIATFGTNIITYKYNMP